MVCLLLGCPAIAGTFHVNLHAGSGCRCGLLPGCCVNQDYRINGQLAPPPIMFQRQ